MSLELGKDFTKEELGGSDIHKINGVVDNVAENEMDAFEQIKKFFVYATKYSRSSRRKDNDDPIDRIDEKLESIIPKDRKTYEMREIIKSISDNNDFFEMTNFYGRGIITGFIRLNGYSAGVFANDSNFYTGL